MATNITGSVSLVYGAHNHSETFNTTATALSHTNSRSNYSAGGSRATATAAALDAGDVSTAHEGLLLIKNINTTGHLLVALDGNNNYDIKIPPATANLISVGTEGVVFVKTAASNLTTHGVASVTAAGVITFDTAVTTAGTYIMMASASPDEDDPTSGTSYVMKTTSDSSTTGTVFELDGTTTKDLTSSYGSSTAVTLNAIVDYRYTLTEA